MRTELTRFLSAPAIAAMVLGVAFLATEALADACEEPDGPRLHAFQRGDAGQLVVNVFIPHRSEVPGLAHYVEHLAWHSATTDRTGNRRCCTGAWTKAQAIHCWISAQVGSVDELVETIGHAFSPTALAEPFALSDREIILRECRQKEVEDPWHRTFEQINVELHNAHPAAVPVLGEPEDVKALDLLQARKLHTRTHLVLNAAFLVEGNVSAKAALRALRKLGFPNRGESEGTIDDPGFSPVSGQRIEVRLARNALAPHVIWRRVVRLNQETPHEVLASRAGLLCMILSASRPAGLAKALRFDREIARSFGARVHAIDGRHAELPFVGHPDRGETLERFAEALEQALAQAARSGIPWATRDQVLRRHARQLPDREHEAEVSECMKTLAAERLSEWRQHPDAETTRNVQGQLALSAIDELLGQLAEKGRTVVAFVDQKVPLNELSVVKPHRPTCLLHGLAAKGIRASIRKSSQNCFARARKGRAEEGEGLVKNPPPDRAAGQESSADCNHGKDDRFSPKQKGRPKCLFNSGLRGSTSAAPSASAEAVEAEAAGHEQDASRCGSAGTAHDVCQCRKPANWRTCLC